MQRWYPINSVGFNADLLSLVAVVDDPDDPTSMVTKLLGPGTDLAYTEPTTAFEPMPGEGTLDLTAAPYAGTSGFIKPLPFIASISTLD